jgi:hypothetical protein
MNSDPSRPGICLLVGVLLVVLGTLAIISGSGIPIGRFQTPTVDWIGWVLLPAGIAICIMTIIWIRRGGAKPKKFTDEEVAQAKKELNMMYFKEHCFWPKTDSKKNTS